MNLVKIKFSGFPSHQLSLSYAFYVLYKKFRKFDTVSEIK